MRLAVGVRYISDHLKCHSFYAVGRIVLWTRADNLVVRNFWSVSSICRGTKPLSYVVSPLVGSKITAGSLEDNSNISASLAGVYRLSRIITKQYTTHGNVCTNLASLNGVYRLSRIITKQYTTHDNVCTNSASLTGVYRLSRIITKQYTTHDNVCTKTFICQLWLCLGSLLY
jgi:hypothetical protein